MLSMDILVYHFCMQDMQNNMQYMQNKYVKYVISYA
jgi:hypothetical protein